MYGRKVKLRFLFIFFILLILSLSVFLVLKSLEENVVYFQSPTQVKSLAEIEKKKIRIGGMVKVESISIKEKNSLNILCRGAAMRYFLTRLYDYTNTPKTALIKIKDPREYYQKIVIHNNLKTYKDYLR